jgi:ketosteroid isomerase-like protein
LRLNHTKQQPVASESTWIQELAFGIPVAQALPATVRIDRATRSIDMLIDETVSVASSISADMSLKHAETISDLYEAFVDGDIEAAGRFVSPDFVMHVPGTGRNAGEYWGVNGFRQFMSNIARHNGGVFDMEVPVFSVSGEHAFTREVIQINRAYDPDRIWTLRISNWMKMRAGRLSELWVIPETQHEYDDYWTPPGEAHAQSRVSVHHRARAKLLHRDRATSTANSGAAMLLRCARQSPTTSSSTSRGTARCRACTRDGRGT